MDWAPTRPIRAHQLCMSQYLFLTVQSFIPMTCHRSELVTSSYTSLKVAAALMLWRCQPAPRLQACCQSRWPAAKLPITRLFEKDGIV